MATRTKPLTMSAAALASAAAVAVASPALAPNFGAPSAPALSKAAYELTTFSDVLSVPSYVWTDVLFGNVPWGNVLGPSNYPVDSNTGLTVRGGYGPAWAQPKNSDVQYAWQNPWAAGCNYSCSSIGISGVAYLFLDALVNGNGAGYNNVNGILQDSTKPYQPDPAQPNYNPYTTQPWAIGSVNYFFEPYTQGFLGSGSSPLFQLVNEGISATAWYTLSGTIGQALPVLQGPINDFFWGTYNVTFAIERTLYTAAALISAVPLVGPFIGNSILAYLGDLEVAPNSGTYYQYGLSGVLNFWVDSVLGNFNPAQPTPPAAATSAVTATANAITAAATTVATTATARVARGKVAAPTAAASAPAASTAAAPVEAVPASQPAAEVTAPAPADSTPAPAAVKTTRQRPVRDAVAGAAKAVGSAVSGAAKAATGGAAAASKRAAANGS